MKHSELRICPCGFPYSTSWVNITTFGDSETNWHTGQHICINCETTKSRELEELLSAMTQNRDAWLETTLALVQSVQANEPERFKAIINGITSALDQVKENQ